MAAAAVFLQLIFDDPSWGGWEIGIEERSMEKRNIEKLLNERRKIRETDNGIMGR